MTEDLGQEEEIRLSLQEVTREGVPERVHAAAETRQLLHPLKLSLRPVCIPSSRACRGARYLTTREAAKVSIVGATKVSTAGAAKLTI